MPDFEFRVRFDEPGEAVTLSKTFRRLCEPMRGQSLLFKYGPIEYRLRVVSIEPRTDAVSIVHLKAEGLAIAFLKTVKWEELKA